MSRSKLKLCVILFYCVTNISIYFIISWITRFNFYFCLRCK